MVRAKSYDSGQPVDVLMPARDAQAYIATAIRSTLAALGPADRLLIGDHGSRDATRSIAKSFRDPRIVIVDTSQSGSLSEVLNHLLSLVDAELVARMDADDVCFPWRFALQRRIMWKKNLDLLFSTVFYINSKGHPLRPAMPETLEGDLLRERLLIHNPLKHPTMIARTQRVVDSGGYRNSEKSEDYELWLRLATNLRIARGALPTIAYRQHPTQVSRVELHEFDEVLDAAWVALARRTYPELSFSGRDRNSTEFAAAALSRARTRGKLNYLQVISHLAAKGDIG